MADTAPPDPFGDALGLAHLLHANYTAYIAVGFTPTQALELIKCTLNATFTASVDAVARDAAPPNSDPGT